MQRKIPPDAFEAYFAMGPARSYQAVAEKYDVTKRAVTNIAAKESWQGRLMGLEVKARQEADKKAVSQLQSMRERHLRSMRFVQAKALEALKRMPIDSAMDAVRALGMSVKEERIIVGEPGERTAIAVEDMIRREHQRWLASEPAPVPEEIEVPQEVIDDNG